MIFTPSDLIEITGATVATDGRPRQVPISSYAISVAETVAEGAFFALSQPDYARNFFNADPGDSNALIPDALARGVQVAFTRNDAYAKHQPLLAQHARRLLFVPDVIVAMQKLARAAYARRPFPAIAITGSAGKTTTKDMIAHLLACCGRAPLVTKRNQNNGIGVALTLLRLASPNRYQNVVLEMGMSSPGGEIARLCTMCPPTVAVLLNVLPAHLAYLGTMEAIARAKFEIVESMASAGVAVLNADDARVRELHGRAPSAVTFGFSADAHVRATDLRQNGFGSAFNLHLGGRIVPVRLPVVGKHNVENALAAFAAVQLVGIDDVHALAEAMLRFSLPPRRGNVHHLANGAYLVDDTYNSSPAALVRAVQAAQLVAGKRGRLILVIGEMHELGALSAKLHYETGAAIALPSVYCMLTLGSATSQLIDGFSAHSRAWAQRQETAADILAHLVSLMQPGDVILVKGSRACRLEQVSLSLLNRYGTLRTARPVRNEKEVTGASQA